MEPFYTAPEGSLFVFGRRRAPPPAQNDKRTRRLPKAGRELHRRHPQVGRTGRRLCCALRYRPAKFENAPQRPSLSRGEVIAVFSAGFASSFAGFSRGRS